MSTVGASQRKNGSRTSSAMYAAAAAAPGRTLGRGVGVAAAAAAAAGLPFGRGGYSTPPARSVGRGVGLPPPPRSRGVGGGSVAATTTLPVSSIDGYPGGDFPSSPGFPFPPTSSEPLFDAAGVDPCSPRSWDNNVHPPGGFLGFFSKQPMNSHLVGALQNDDSSPTDVEILVGDPSNENANVRTEKRIMWTVDEEVSLMSAWIEHSTDSTCGADKGGVQYWSEVVATYNKTTPALRRRSAKQCKDRWHKVNKLTDLFECAYVKARRVFTSGYSDDMWKEVAHNFYLEDNKDNKDVVGPFMLEKVWKICRDVPKWKTYNEKLKNARKRKSFHLEGDFEENEDGVDEVPERPIGQKAAKKVALAAKSGKLKGSSSNDDGHSKDSPIELDTFERYSKFQETNNDNRMKMLDRQEKIASDKLEATRIAHMTAQDYKEGKKLEKETKLMETYNNLASQDTSSMTDDEKAQRLSMMKKLEKAIFPE